MVEFDKSKWLEAIEEVIRWGKMDSPIPEEIDIIIDLVAISDACLKAVNILKEDISLAYNKAREEANDKPDQ
jgi:hypothetical protein